MIKIENLKFGYNNRQMIIDGFDLKIPANSVVAITGKSGSGKTTLLRLIAGLEKPSGGKISSDYSRLSYSTAESDLFPGFSAVDNVSVVCSKEEAERHLKAIGLGDSMHQSIDQFSTGMKRRVSIARAVANKPEVLILDEPFASLDDKTKEMVISYIKKESQAEIIIFSTHDSKDIEFMDAINVPI